MAQAVCPQKEEGSQVFSGSPMYFSPDAAAVGVALLEEFPGIVTGTFESIEVEEALWREYSDAIKHWLRTYFCGFGYYKGHLSIHPLTVKVL